MFATFDREPLGWGHPLYCRRRPVHPVVSWNQFVQPALETVDTLNHLIQLANLEERLQTQTKLQPSDQFQMKIDVQQFSPEELDVKLVDNCVLIEGKHEEKQDEHGFISRHFVRRYQLPADVKPETVTCNLSSDGVLCISAPRMIEEKKTSERSVPINFTGKPALSQEPEKDNLTKKVSPEEKKSDVAEEGASSQDATIAA